MGIFPFTKTIHCWGTPMAMETPHTPQKPPSVRDIGAEVRQWMEQEKNAVLQKDRSVAPELRGKFQLMAIGKRQASDLTRGKDRGYHVDIYIYIYK